MNIKCTLETGISKEGKKYYYLYVEEIGKRVFLTEIEVKYLLLTHKELVK